MSGDQCPRCHGTYHVKDFQSGVWEQCDCYYHLVQKRRLKGAGFPDSVAAITAEEAINLSGYAVHAAGKKDPAGWLARVAGWLLCKPPETMLLIPERAAVDTYPLGCFFASKAAFFGEVAQTNGIAMIEREWNIKDAVAHLTTPNFLLVWGFGGDNEHVWLRTLYYRVFYTRIQHQKPTVVSFVPGGTLEVNRLYGQTVDLLLQRQSRLD